MRTSSPTWKPAAAWASDFYDGFGVGVGFDGVAKHFDEVAGAVLVAGDAAGVAGDVGWVEGLHLTGTYHDRLQIAVGWSGEMVGKVLIY